MGKKRLFVDFVVIVVFIIILFYWTREDVHSRIKKSIFYLRGDREEVVKDAVEYLIRHPLESLPYLMAEISNTQQTCVVINTKIPDAINAHYFPRGERDTSHRL
jgi:hypothetical protein